MADQSPALTTDDYQRLYTMQMSEDPSVREQASAIAKKLTPEEGHAFFKFQQDVFKARGGERQDTSLMRIGGEGDTGGFEIPPEAVVMGPLQAIRAGFAPGLSAVQRTVAAGSELAKGATPIVKYEVARHALTAAGLPAPLAYSVAMWLSGKGGAARAAETGMTKEELINEAVEKYGLRRTEGGAPIQRGPGGRPLRLVTPAEATAPTELTGRPPVQVTPPPETAPVTPPAPAQAPTAAPDAAAPARTPAKPSTPIPQGVAIKQAVDAFADVKTMPLGGEVSNAAAFVQRGFSPAEAVAKVLAKRPAVPQSAAEALMQRLGTPSDEAVAQSVLERNATGKWKK